VLASAPLSGRTIGTDARAGNGRPRLTGDLYRMSLDKATVARIAHLARIRMADEDLAPMATELSRILDWVEQLDAVPTDGVEPMTSVAPHALRRRPDAVTDGDAQDRVLSNAPEAVSGFFAVPKVVE